MKFGLVLVLVLVLACGRSSTSTSTSTSTKKQLVTVTVDDWSSIHATLRQWERAGDGWRAIGAPWRGVIGVHGAVRPEDKHEGDGKSPAGRFPLQVAYGYAAAPPPGTKLPYTQVDTPWECVDDPKSPHYAQIVDRDHVEADWSSSELMRRSDKLYTWVIDTGYNPAHVPGAGSCIFLHVWHGPDAPTVGCTAMAEGDLVRVLAWLDPAASPELVLLPRDEYRAVAAPWGLPAQ